MYLLINFCNKFLYAVNCEKGPEICNYNFQIQLHLHWESSPQSFSEVVAFVSVTFSWNKLLFFYHVSFLSCRIVGNWTQDNLSGMYPFSVISCSRQTTFVLAPVFYHAFLMNYRNCPHWQSNSGHFPRVYPAMFYFWSRGISVPSFVWINLSLLDQNMNIWMNIYTI